jgi:hypothetical protein
LGCALHSRVETASQINPTFHPQADVQTLSRKHDAHMTTTDYLIDSALILLVLTQIKERPLTARQLLRPLVVLGIAVTSYLHGVPTAGNDLVLAGALVMLGGAIGVASGKTVIMRRGGASEALARSGWLSGFFWVLGMGSRMAFLVWIAHGGSTTIAHFSAQHSITSPEAWTVALLGMAAGEVLGRTTVLALRLRETSVQPALVEA